MVRTGAILDAKQLHNRFPTTHFHASQLHQFLTSQTAWTALQLHLQLRFPGDSLRK
jgi:hypothetical protein